MNKIKIVTVQNKVFEDKYETIERLAELIGDGAVSGADIMVLPEMWNCPYKTRLFPEYAEPETGDSWLVMSTLARKNKIYVVGGSIPEVDDEGRVYNTCYVFDRNGEQIGKHRKVHLFDVNFGEKPFHESDTLTAGDGFRTFETEWGKMGVNICFDVRFPESMRLLALDGAKMVFLPTAFLMNTGEAHWDMNIRMRAVENQIFVAAVAPMRDSGTGYKVWAHSMISDPWGNVLVDMGTEEGYTITEIDLDEIDRIRSELPLMCARREDIYKLETE